jgi:inosine-uridine nucleoside N-ribohydrolase
MLLRNIRAKSEPFVTKIIIDTHGGLEDVIAIMHSIKFAKFNKMEIIGITVTNGRRTLEEATTDALLAVILSGASIPIYKGKFCPIKDPIKQ